MEEVVEHIDDVVVVGWYFIAVSVDKDVWAVAGLQLFFGQLSEELVVHAEGHAFGYSMQLYGYAFVMEVKMFLSVDAGPLAVPLHGLVAGSAICFVSYPQVYISACAQGGFGVEGGQSLSLEQYAADTFPVQ